MNAHLQSLIELQKHDLRIQTLRERQQHLPQQIKQAQAPVLELQSRLDAKQRLGEGLAKERREAERTLSEQEAHIQKIRGRLNELKTNKEYQAHLFEIELARKKKDTLEEAVLSVLERIELNEAEVKTLKQELSEAWLAFEKEKASLEAQEESLRHELEELERHREELAGLIDATLLARYTKLKTLRKGFAVTEVRNGACFGCRLQLPPQLVAEVKRGQELLNCSYCHRILYWEAQAEEPGACLESPSSNLHNA